MNKPMLNKGNCFLYMILFKLKNPSAKIRIGWNKKSNIISFSAVINKQYVFYKRRDRRQSSFWFNGKVVVIDKRPSVYDLQEQDLINIAERGYSNNL